MEVQTVIWRSRLRPILRRLVQPLLVVLGFAVAFTAGTELAFLIFGKPLTLFAYPPLFPLSGLPFALLFVLFRRKNFGDRYRLLRWNLAVAAFAFLLLTDLHFVREKPKQPWFLGNQAAVYITQSVPPGGIYSVYTFPADLDALRWHASLELSLRGYLLRDRNGHLDAWVNRYESHFGSQWSIPDEVSISPGQATDLGFQVDADIIGTVERPGWVTVAVVQPSGLPYWIDFFTP